MYVYFKIHISITPNFWMEPAQSSKKFDNIEEVFNSQGKAVGFTVPGNDFVFRYLADGGWRDQKGNKYSADGQLVKASDIHSDDDDGEQQDEQILDQFQKMLDDDVTDRKQPKPKKNQEQDIKQEDQIDYEEQSKKYIQQYKNKQKIRDGLPSQLHIYYKINAEHRVEVKPVVEFKQSIKDKNQKIKQLVQQAQKQSNNLKQKNKWLAESAQFDYSGICQDQVNYQRYWYGHLKTTPQNYLSLIKQIDESQQFGLLEQKTFYALKSKFYLKKKMQKTIEDLQKDIEKVEDDQLITITINNLPQNFPCSYILDLCDYSDTPLQQIHSIDLIDQFTATITLSKQGTAKFLNVEGFCHAQKQYIYLDVEPNKQNKKIKRDQLFKISTDSKYKIHHAQLHDIMTLSLGPKEVAKTASQQDEKKDGYRFIVGRNALKKVLMYRGNSMNVTKIENYARN